jgi:hypothetical protein
MMIAPASIINNPPMNRPFTISFSSIMSIYSYQQLGSAALTNLAGGPTGHLLQYTPKIPPAHRPCGGFSIGHMGRNPQAGQPIQEPSGDKYSYRRS